MRLDRPAWLNEVLAFPDETLAIFIPVCFCCPRSLPANQRHLVCKRRKIFFPPVLLERDTSSKGSESLARRPQALEAGVSPLEPRPSLHSFKPSLCVDSPIPKSRSFDPDTPVSCARILSTEGTLFTRGPLTWPSPPSSASTSPGNCTSAHQHRFYPACLPAPHQRLSSQFPLHGVSEQCDFQPSFPHTPLSLVSVSLISNS